jgi:hypothetical protein
LKIFEYKLPKHTYTRSRAADHSDVTSLLYSICNFDFVVSIVIVQMCLAFKKSLQERSLDIVRALKSVTLGQSSLDCRANVGQFNHQCFERSVEICELLDIEVKKPRICGRHIMRDNVEADCPEDYFRKSITVPFLDYALNEMKTSFFRPTRQNRFGTTVGSIYY